MCTKPYDSQIARENLIAGSVWQCGECNIVWLFKSAAWSGTQLQLGPSIEWVKIESKAQLAKMRLNNEVSPEAYAVCEKVLA